SLLPPTRDGCRHRDGPARCQTRHDLHVRDAGSAETLERGRGLRGCARYDHDAGQTCHCSGSGEVMSVPTLSENERRTVLDAVLKAIATKSIVQDPDIDGLRATHEQAVVQATSPVEFETAMNAMLRSLGVSHAGFFHESSPRTAGRVAIAATFTKAQTDDGERWVFQD